MTPEDIHAFWFEGDRHAFRQRWFERDDAFDAACGRFAALLAPAREGALDGWMESPAGSLGLCLVLDQFPRNLHRGTPAAFACDGKAREVAREAVLRRRQDLALTPTERIFLYLPFEHAESMADQDRSVALFEGLRDIAAFAAPEGAIAYAWQHWRVIREFGRFPHRNAALGRPNTPAEEAYLARPDAGF